jgi:hypothetical protein
MPLLTKISEFILLEVWLLITVQLLLKPKVTQAETRVWWGFNLSMGNSLAYNTGTTTQLDPDNTAYWIESGFENQIMIFNNGNGRSGGILLEIIKPPVNGYNYTQTLPYACYNIILDLLEIQILCSKYFWR